MKRKQLLFTVMVFCSLLLMLSNCKSSYDKIPEPERNPVILSSDAHSIELRIKNIAGIRNLPGLGTLEGKKDEIGNTIVDTFRFDGWLEVVYDLRQGNKETQIITITVTENQSSDQRSCRFKVGYQNEDIILTVTQEGKK